MQICTERVLVYVSTFEYIFKLMFAMYEKISLFMGVLFSTG
jgi:hypothetical protein